MTKIEIENSPTPFQKPGTEGEFLTRAEVLASIVGSVPADKGATYEEIYRRTKVLDVLECCNGTIELTAKQADIVKQAWQSHRWPILHPHILEIGEALGVVVEDD